MPAPRHPDDQGSVLMLVPAAVLVLFVLAAMAVDYSIAFLAQRELSAAAAAAANDAAGAALSDDAFYRGGDPGRIVLDGARAQALAGAALEARDIRGVHDVHMDTAIAGDRVCVTVAGRVDHIFSKAVPGAARGRTVTGRAVATAIGGSSAEPPVADPCRS